MEYTKWTKDKVLEFCENNFLGEGFEDSLADFLEGEEAILEMDTADVPSSDTGNANTELTIKIKLHE